MTNRSLRNLAFENKIRAIINEHLSDESFGVSELARELNVSRTTLHRKVKVATGKSVSAFIREIRLKHAYKMLQNGSVTVSEVAYKVGFSSATYFNKCFHDFYGMPPGDILKGNHAEQEEFEEPESENESAKPSVQNRKKIRRGLIFTFIVVSVSVAVVYWMNSHSSIKKRENVIAVLPFDNLGSVSDSLGLAEGIRGSIINLLMQINGIRIVSLTSSDKYQNSRASAQHISRDLGAQYLLEGEVQKNSEWIQITINLEDAIKNELLIHKPYKHKLTDIFELQSAIARTIADTLQLVLTPREIKTIKEKPTEYTDAYFLYVNGRSYWNKRTKEGIQQSIRLFKEATEVDPDYALAFAGLADAYFISSGYGFIQRKEGSGMAKAYAEKALEINQNLAEAHTTLGFTLGYDEWQWEKAEKELIKAIDLNPQYAFAHHAYALLLDVTGNDEKAQEEINLALQYEPLSPIYHHVKISLFYNEGNFEMSLDQCRDLRMLEPNFPSIHFWFFKNYYRLDNSNGALRSLQTMLEQDSITAKFSPLAPTVLEENGLDGLIDWILEISENIKKESEDSYNTLYWIRYMTELYAIAGENSKALDLLEEYLKSNSEGDRLVRLLNNRDYMALRDEERFKEVVKKLNLDNY